jgi:hypothetical protein
MMTGGGLRSACCTAPATFYGVFLVPAVNSKITVRMPA